MLQVSGLYKAYGEQSLFEDVSFSLSRGERLGIVGRNGSGKSTLFRLVLGLEHPDDGEIRMPKFYRTGHLAQHLSFNGKTVLQEAAQGLGEHEECEEYKARMVLAGLGFTEPDMDKPVSEFSGGFQIRIELARVLLSEPDLLLLDEPTNYLDIVSLRWLERFLRAWKGELMIITHDREFMDSVCTHTMMIQRRNIRKIEGGTEKLYKQAALDDQVYEQTRLNIEAQRREMEAFIERFRAQASKASLVQSRVKALERLGKREELEAEQQLDFNFRSAPFPGKNIIEVENLSFRYEPQFPLLVHNLSLAIGKQDRIGVIGKNGKGKSTLLRLLAGELLPSGGKIKCSGNAVTGYFGQTNIQRLSPDLTVEEEIRSVNEALSRTAVRSICGTMMFSGDDALKKIRILSGGEKSRVLLGKLLARPSNLLLLDEPNNHLDIRSVDALIDSLKSFNGAVVVVTHNERMLRSICTRLIVFQSDLPEVLEDGYDYFLERIGWVEEGEEGPAFSSPSGGRETRGDRRKRAQAREKRARIVKPLESEVRRIEDRICELEQEVRQAEAELVEASQNNDREKIVTLARSSAAARAEIEQHFDLLSEAMAQLQRAESELETGIK